MRDPAGFWFGRRPKFAAARRGAANIDDSRPIFVPSDRKLQDPVTKVSIRPSLVGISTKHSGTATSSSVSIPALDAALRAVPDVRQHAGVVLLHDPAGERQPVERRLELERVPPARDDVGTSSATGE